MVLPKKLVSVFDERLGFYSCTVPTFEQYVIARLIQNGDFERHINRVRRNLRKKLKLKPLKPQYSESNITKANFFRYSLLLIGFIIVGVAGVPLLYLISPPSIISSQTVMLVKYFTLTAEFIILPIILILEFLYRCKRI